LENDEWKYDRIPEIIDGKNIADFIDIDIEKKLEALEREEAERLRQRPAYLEDSDVHNHAINSQLLVSPCLRFVVLQNHSLCLNLEFQR
jgi:hypothetical protein